jgi:hypothetical protein
MKTRKFRFPLSTLLGEADGLLEALKDNAYTAAMQERLGDDTATPPVVIATDFAAAIKAVRDEVKNQGGKTGDASDLTEDQRDAVKEVERLIAGARRSARQAFPGEAKLRSEFQVGVDEPNGLDADLERAALTLVAARKYAVDLKKKGWLPRDANDLETALGQVSGVGHAQDAALADRAQFTAALTRAANALYELCLAAQNAARLEYPSTKLGTEAARARFKLETFPPRDRSQPDGGTQSDDTEGGGTEGDGGAPGGTTPPPTNP